MKKILLLIIFGITALFLNSCYTDTIDALSTFKFQLAILFHSNYYNKAAPDTSLDFTNLMKYKEYNDNKDRIKTAQVYQFNYWIDSIHVDKNKPFEPGKDNLEFEFIKFYLVFAKTKPGRPEGSINDFDYEIDPQSQKYLLGEFKDVNVNNYYRIPNHILEISESTAQLISEAVRNRPQFYIISEYSKAKGQTEPKRYFPLIFARFDLVIRFNVEL